jgi:hypothetical protein
MYDFIFETQKTGHHGVRETHTDRSVRLAHTAITRFL